MSESSDQIIPVDIEEEMRSAYIDYAMRVIIARALPDVRDGLKPVHRRVLYGMTELGLSAGKPYKKSARIVGECFTAGTLVSTPKGLIPIENLAIGDQVYTQKSIRKVSQLYEMPEQPLLEIMTSQGVKTTCTLGQLFKVFTPDWKIVWRKAEDLQEGDYILSRLVGQSSAEFIQQGKTTINPEIAYLMGFFINNEERQITPQGAKVCHPESKLIQRIRAIINKQFEQLFEIHQEDKQYTIHLDLIWEQLANDLQLLSLIKDGAKLPDYLLQSPEDVIYGLVAGLVDAHEEAFKSKNSLEIHLHSEQLARQLQTLLFSFGISASILANQKRSDIFTLEIVGNDFIRLAQKLDLAHPDKQKRIPREEFMDVEMELEQIPYLSEKIQAELGVTDKKEFFVSPQNVNLGFFSSLKTAYAQFYKLKVLKKLGKVGAAYQMQVKELWSNGLKFSEVMMVRPAAPAKTYDIQVEVDHEFIANGLLVHNCLGKYHPHGDASVYDTMVRMAQPWSLRYPLVDGQGNFGSVDGDSPAAMRYTEARLQRIAEELLADINKETVDFQPNFDESLQEPVVLPSKIPQLLVNGTSGIAVGMATNMPPHNINEVVDGIIAYLENPEIDINGLMEHIPAPDFPTGGTIYGYQGVRKAYFTGRGRIVIRGTAEIQTDKSGKTQIIVSEIPYLVNKALLIEKTAQMVQDKRIEGISGLRDESDRKGMRIVYDLRRDAVPMVVLNQLYKYTALQSSFGVNSVALVNGKPQTLNLKETIHHYVEHRYEVVYRRTEYELKEAKHRQHILEGLIIALDHLDEVIALIRASKDTETAKNGLMEKFALSEIQSKAILEMRLQRLTALERDKILEEYKKITELILKLEAILADKSLQTAIIREELLEMKQKYGDGRRSTIEYVSDEVTDEDMIKVEEMVISISHHGYIKRTSLSEYRTQGRGGVGSRGVSSKGDDFTEHLFIASTHDYILIFTLSGQVYWVKAYQIPEGGKTAKGRAIQNIVQMDKEDKVRAVINVSNLSDPDYITNHYLVMATERGIIKKTSLEAFSRPRQNGIRAINFNEGDRLLDVKLTNGDSDIILAVSSGRAIRFHESNVRPMGRTATGVRGIVLEDENDLVVGLVCINREDPDLLVVSENGYGKRSAIEDYRSTNRGGKGIKTMQITDKTGKLIAIKEVIDQDDLMLVNRLGMVIRMRVSDMRVMGRATQGVKLIRLNEDDTIVSVAKIEIVEEEEQEQTETNMNGQGQAETENLPDSASSVDPTSNGQAIDNNEVKDQNDEPEV